MKVVVNNYSYFHQRHLLLPTTVVNSSYYDLVMINFFYDRLFPQQRNKPKEPPKVPKSAPFFLPTLPGVDFQFDVKNESEDAKVGIISIANHAMASTIWD